MCCRQVIRFCRLSIAAVGFVLACALSHAATLLGRVVRVIDGDTVVFLHDDMLYRVRLEGIDAPEWGQAYARQSRNNLAFYVAGERVYLKFHKKDQYGEIVGRIIQYGSDINLKQIRDGMAWYDRKYQNEQSPIDRARYMNAQLEAKKAMRGLWRVRDPIPPWRWRMQAAREKRSDLRPLTPRSESLLFQAKQHYNYHITRPTSAR